MLLSIMIEMNSEKNTIWPDPFCPLPALYLVATPIGNLRDVTLRALDVLQASDVILCEDTRVSGKFLKAYGIKKPLKTYHDHSTEKDRAEILKILGEGKCVALISDAGMPLIADPGYKLVEAVRAQGLPVYAIPGANAPLMALQLSGLPSDAFSFHGFLPPKQKARQDALEALKGRKETLIFFETAPRLLKSLQDIAGVYGEINCVVARELTKKFEEVRSGSARDLISYFEDNTLKGEIVLLIGPSEQDMSEDDIDAQLKKMLKEMSVKESVATLVDATGLPKKMIYNKALELKDKV